MKSNNVKKHIVYNWELPYKRTRYDECDMLEELDNIKYIEDELKSKGFDLDKPMSEPRYIKVDDAWEYTQ